MNAVRRTLILAAGLVSTANFAAGSYNLIIANASSQDESIALQVVLSQGACAALSSAPPSSASSAHEAGPWPALIRQARGALR